MPGFSSLKRQPVTVLLAICSLTFSLALLVLSTMQASEASARPAPATRVLTNGSVYTVNGPQAWAEAVAIRGSRIIAVGSADRIRRFVGPKTKVTNLKGHMLMPGLQDGHSHPVGGGESLTSCSLDYESLTVPKFRQRIQACLDATADQEPNAWLQVGAWNAEETRPAGTIVTKADLAGLDTQRPIIVQNSDGHKALVNQRGLDLAGIDDSTPNPPGGVIDRDGSGEATGLLFEGAQGLAYALIPPTSDPDRVRFAKAGLDAMNSVGVTSTLDALGGPEALKAYATLRRRGQLHMRLRVATEMTTDDAKHINRAIRQQVNLRKKYSKGLVRAGVIKIFADGVLEFPAQTAALLKPCLVRKHGRWVPGTSHGNLQISQKLMNRLAVNFNRRGFQVHIHAIGDRGVRNALNAFAASRKANHTRGWGNRNTITHLQLVDPKDYPRFRKTRTIASMQFQWFQRDAYTIQGSKNYIGPARFKRMYPARSLVDNGALLAGASDWPVDPLMPWYALEKAVTRTADSWYGYANAPLNANQAISLRQAVRAYTLGTAFEMKQDRTTGSIEPGKQADLIVLDRNLFRIKPASISSTRVLSTMVAGKFVHQAR